MGFRGPTGLIGSSPKDPIVVRSHKLYQIRLWSHYRGWSQLVCSFPNLGSVREQAVAQEGAEGLAEVGFLLALAEALSCARHKFATSCGGCDGSLDRGLNLCKALRWWKVSGPRRVSVYNPLKPSKFLKLQRSHPLGPWNHRSLRGATLLGPDALPYWDQIPYTRFLFDFW